MLTKILVPMDGSILSEKVLPYALKLAVKLDLQVTLLRVVENSTFLEKEQLENSEAAQAARAYLSKVSGFLTSNREKPLIPLSRLQTKLLFGNPAEEICKYVPEENFDLVTMTTHGRPQTHEYFVGSVTRQVLQHLNVPVLLVRPFWQKSRGRNGLSEIMSCLNEPFGKRFLANGVQFVLPLDMTDKAEASLDLGFVLAQKLNATLYLLKVNNPPAYPEDNPLLVGPSAWSGLDLANRNEANLYLKQIEKMAEKNDFKAVKIVLTGNPATEILAFVELMGSDALIMATHAFGEETGVNLPSLTHEIMRRSHLPVFMVPLPRPVGPKAQNDPVLITG